MLSLEVRYVTLLCLRRIEVVAVLECEKVAEQAAGKIPQKVPQKSQALHYTPGHHCGCPRFPRFDHSRCSDPGLSEFCHHPSFLVEWPQPFVSGL